MRYVTARYESHQRDWAYRFYIAENLRIIGENTAKALMKGTSVSKTLQEFIEDYMNPKPFKTGDEVVADVLNKLGLEAKDG